MHRIACPHCGHRLKYAAEHIGKKAKCQKCGRAFRLPQPAPLAAPLVSAPGKDVSEAPPQQATPYAPKLSLIPQEPTAGLATTGGVHDRSSKRTCPKCGQPTTIWNAELVSGFCKKCRDAAVAEDKARRLQAMEVPRPADPACWDDMEAVVASLPKEQTQGFTQPATGENAGGQRNAASTMPGTQSGEAPGKSKLSGATIIMVTLGWTSAFLIVVAIVGAIALEGSGRARSIGVLLLAGGGITFASGRNSFESARNGCFFGLPLVLAGLVAIISGEIPQWFLNFLWNIVNRK